MRRELQPRRGFTLVELLVVITIIGILVALLLPAVQAAREAARMTQCRNNVKQLAPGCLLHESATKRLPTGGWGTWWTGDADLGTGQRQPGGWMYNVLPFIEQQAMHDMGAGLPAAQKGVANFQRYGIPLSGFYCPTRRSALAYPYDGAVWIHSFVNCSPSMLVAMGRQDYSINGGDYFTSGGVIGTTMVGAKWFGDEAWGGPYTLADGGVPPCSQQQLTLARETFTQVAQTATGVSYCGSLIKLSDITNGTSQTYLLGEKELNPDCYLTGVDGGDNEGAMVGEDEDIVRWTAVLGPNPSYYLPPLEDLPGYSASTDTGYRFGSAHAAGFNMAMCDGSVRTINYSIDPETHRRLSNRKNELVIDAKKF